MKLMNDGVIRRFFECAFFGVRRSAHARQRQPLPPLPILFTRPTIERSFPHE